MRRLLLISLAIIPLTGCQFFNKGADVAVVDPLDPASVGEAVASLPNGAATTDAGDEAFSDPTVASAKTSVSADLIQSTDANARALKVQRSRNDPFATLPIPPPPEPAELPVGAVGNRAGPSRSASSGVSSSSSGGSSGSSSGGSSGGGSRVTSGNRGSSSSSGRAPTVAARPAPTPPPVRVQPANRPLVTPAPIAALPPVPQPAIAQTVSVSGVIQLGNESYAIVRSGSEPERYVKVGDRIAGGSVRVKRIETLAFEPKVILEENGIEVSRPITANAETANAGAASPATPSVPVPAATPPVVPAPGSRALLPGISPLPAPAAATTLQSYLGSIPSSLILSPAEMVFQAVVPGLPVTAVSSV